jgi:hypothetical protein
MNKNDITNILIKASGLTLLTSSFFALPKALGAIFNICSFTYFLAPHITREGPISDVYSTLLSNYISTSISSLFTFVILFVLARWMLKGPKLIEKWVGVNQSEDKEKQP